LSSDSGVPGSEVLVSGSGFGPTERIALAFYDRPLGEPAFTDIKGAFADAKGQIPRDWIHDGPVTITATGEKSGRSAGIAFQVLATEIRVARTSTPGKVGVKGSGFVAEDEVQLCASSPEIGGPTAAGCTTVAAEDDGSFCQNVGVPSGAKGLASSYVIKASGASQRSASASLSVPAPWKGEEPSLCG